MRHPGHSRRSTIAGRLVGAGMACSLLVPTWIVMDVAGLPFDVRLISAAGLMILYCFLPGGIIRSRLNWIDMGIAGLAVAHVISDSFNSGFYALLPVRAYGEWALPYVAGRFALMHPGHIQRLAPWFVFVAYVISLGAVWEAFTGVRVWETLILPRDDLVEVGGGKRYGWLYRAWGPMRHPIFLGCVLMLLVPWAAAKASVPGWRKWVGRVGIVVLVCGIAATMSRGPLLFVLSAGLFAAAFYVPVFRWVLAGAVVLGLVSAVAFRSALVEVLDWTETPDLVATVVEVDGEYQRNTATRTRLFALSVYGPLVVKGGPWGFGTDAVTSSPPNLPGLPQGREARKAIGIVENSFILIGLRLGWFGLASLLLTLIGSIVYAFVLAASDSPVTYPYGNGFLVALGAVLIGICLQTMTVFASYEFYFWILFTAGMVSGLVVLDGRIRRGEVEFE